MRLKNLLNRIFYYASHFSINCLAVHYDMFDQDNGLYDNPYIDPDYVKLIARQQKELKNDN